MVNASFQMEVLFVNVKTALLLINKDTIAQILTNVLSAPTFVELVNVKMLTEISSVNVKMVTLMALQRNA
jgi:hypothetical protein